MIITGANGYLGTRLIYLLYSAGKKPHSIYHSQIPDYWLSRGSAKVLTDLAHTTKTYDALHYIKSCDLGVSTIVHLAGKAQIGLASSGTGYTRPTAKCDDVASNYRNNVITTANLLEAAIHLGYKHIVFASSQSVYGWNAASGVTTEDTPVDPMEYYAASKTVCEDMLRLASSHIAVTVLRISGVFGGSRTAGLVRTMLNQAKTNNKIIINFEYPIPFDFVHVADVAAAAYLATTQKPNGYKIYNISSGDPCSPRIMAERIALLYPGTAIEETGVPCPTVLISNERALRELKWLPEQIDIRLKQEKKALNG